MDKKFYQNKAKTVTIFHDKEYGWHFLFGIDCGNGSFCKYAHKCRYCRSWKIRIGNRLMDIRRFVERYFGIKLPYSRVHFSRNWQELSGTPKCPYHTTRETGCHRCQHCGGMNENCDFLCKLSREERGGSYDDGFWKYQCPSFKDCERPQ